MARKNEYRNKIGPLLQTFPRLPWQKSYTCKNEHKIPSLNTWIYLRPAYSSTHFSLLIFHFSFFHKKKTGWQDNGALLQVFSQFQEKWTPCLQKLFDHTRQIVFFFIAFIVIIVVIIIIFIIIIIIVALYYYYYYDPFLYLSPLRLTGFHRKVAFWVCKPWSFTGIYHSLTLLIKNKPPPHQLSSQGLIAKEAF